MFRLPLYYTPYDVTMVIFPSKIDLPKRVSKGPNMASLSAIYIYIYSMHIQCLRNTFCRKHDTVFLALQYWSNSNTASSLTSQSVNNLHITCFTSFLQPCQKACHRVLNDFLTLMVAGIRNSLVISRYSLLNSTSLAATVSIRDEI